MRLEDAIKSNRFTNERHKASLNVMYTAYWLKCHVSAALKDIGLTTEQYNVLRILKGKYPEQMCVKDIAGRMIEKNSNVPRIIERLVTKKYVKRTTSKTDKRETLIALTERGIADLETASKIVDAVTEKHILLNDQDAELLNTLLEKMRQTEEL